MKTPSVRAKERARARNDGEGIFLNSFFMEGKTGGSHPELAGRPLNYKFLLIGYFEMLLKG
jgi:hypothetical protein